MSDLVEMAKKAIDAVVVHSADRMSMIGNHHVYEFLATGVVQEMACAAVAPALARIEALEENIEALEATLRAYEEWEADLITNNSWSGKDGLPTLTQSQYDRMLEIQA